MRISDWSSDVCSSDLAQGIFLGAFLNQGQVCTAGSRIFAHKDIADELKAKIIALIPELAMGDPFNDQTRMGTLVSKEHLARVREYIEIEIGRASCRDRVCQ